MCAHTNKAVDRIMEGLLKSGYTDFLRVGLLDKIARSVLPYALYYTSDTNENTGTAAELKRQLQNVQSPEDASILRHVLASHSWLVDGSQNRNELQEVEKGMMHRRREKLSSACVVGVTCCSVNSSFLQGLTFDVILLDEACQIIEPLSILPLIKTGSKWETYIIEDKTGY